MDEIWKKDLEKFILLLGKRTWKSIFFLLGKDLEKFILLLGKKT